ncbi:hypothetical protein [Nitrosopumilus sp.]|uniref:hypothetical protein n=1 Tax=Nitrosopumilus sp. TaxID=2024843 RepID=UPI00247EF5CE|nr:hypothetical protein [Nitrosopumilus sp.]MCV0409634.1 hypothetical protein [Nitrosopumilus sp.]
MKTMLLIIIGMVVFTFISSQALACSKGGPDLNTFSPWSEKLHGDCSVTVGNLSWLGMIYIILAFIVPLIVIIRKKKLSKKLYLLIPVIIFVVMIFYSIFIYGTPDITQFAVPHGIYGGIDYDTVAWLETDKDFKRMLNEKNIVYSDEHFNTGYDYSSGTNYDNLEYQIIMPASYCGFVISDDGDEYWYTATFDKIITSSELHEANPYDCSGESKECVCNMQKGIRERFSENEH